MSILRIRLLSGMLFLALGSLWAQEGATLFGSLDLRGNFYIRDSLIGAADIPQYDRQKYGANAWLNLNYNYAGFQVGVRFDLFQNSQLLNPTASYTAQGIGRWFVKKDLNKLSIAGGYLYDQIGSGIIFRAYEARALAIDNALYGLRLSYDFVDDWTVTGFTGRQKRQFELFESNFRAVRVEGFATAGTAEKPITFSPGFGAVGRTFDDNTINSLVATLNTYLEQDAFVPNYNTYAFTLYNTLSVGPINWYVEGAYKTEDAMNDPFGSRMTASGQEVTGNTFFESEGTVLYTSLSYAKKGFGITLEGKHTNDFSFRNRPQAVLNRAIINFLPAMSRENTYRLTTRYVAATQELGEYALKANIMIKPSRKWNFLINGSYINTLEEVLLYRELYTQAEYKPNRDWIIKGGVQLQHYNQEVYQFKPGAPIVDAVTPFVDVLYKLSRRNAVRLEAQYMHTGQDLDLESGKMARHDYGSWVFGQVELTLAPNWTFTASDMYNAAPGKLSPVDENGEKVQLHYPRFDIFYNYKTTRYSLSYVKQVEGIVCTGGVCRLEPAFSGVQATLLATF